MNLLNLSKLSLDEMLSGSFGIEWESLRARGDGELALTPHPELFGDKLKNPLVTTDFSESQIEIITPTFNTIDETFDTFSLIADLVNASLPYDEYLWFQSIPCILPYGDQIPIAQYSGEGKSSQRYREDLAKKYGLKKQMISGIHFNFSFSDEFLKKIYELEESPLTFKEFKNNVYLKIARNYLRYCWLIIYLTGCSIGSHNTFSKDCIRPRASSATVCDHLCLVDHSHLIISLKICHFHRRCRNHRTFDDFLFLPRHKRAGNPPIVQILKLFISKEPQRSQIDAGGSPGKSSHGIVGLS